MTKRKTCIICLRPSQTCICKHIQSATNFVPLMILQHPQEVNEVKNSAKLLSLCLKNSCIEVGEAFSARFFQDHQDQGYYDLLLYPDTPEKKSLGIAHPLSIDHTLLTAGDNLSSKRKVRIWVLDATWRKSRKMLYINPALQTMPRLSLQQCPSSIYKIRKAHSENQLSTLEATCYALQQLEHNAVDYTPVLNAFAAFVAEQQTFLPSSL